jgi:hypothetical protein
MLLDSVRSMEAAVMNLPEDSRSIWEMYVLKCLTRHRRTFVLYESILWKDRCNSQEVSGSIMAR